MDGDQNIAIVAGGSVHLPIGKNGRMFRFILRFALFYVGNIKMSPRDHRRESRIAKLPQTLLL